MTRQEMIDLLNSDLKNEYKHMLFYLRSSVLVRGLHREPIKAFLEREAQAEFTHVQDFSKRVVSIGGTPLAAANDFPVLEDPREILTYALEMEHEVVENYARRMQQADELGGVDGITIRLFYEKQLEDSYNDMVEIKEMLGGLH